MTGKVNTSDDLVLLKDSGERRKFDSGAVRDIQIGKGRCDLLPLREVGHSFRNPECELLFTYLSKFMDTGNVEYLYGAVESFMHTQYEDDYTPILELSKHLESGALKYGEHNWEKGIPLHSFIDSGIRHLLQYFRGDTDDPHSRAFIWNMYCAIWTIRNRPECVDIEFPNSTSE